MNFTRIALAAAMLALATAPADAQPRPIAAQDVPIGSQVGWSAEANPRPIRYRFGDIAVSVRPQVDPESVDLVAPIVTLEVPGRAPVVLEGADTRPSYEHKVGVGRFDRNGTRFLYLQSFTGGAHCCNTIQVAQIPAQGPVSVVALGDWDGGPEEQMPKDEDGDGIVDFVQRDNRFLYAFSSYAGSLAPPQILNIVDGQVADVSARPSFRRFFVEAMAAGREGCREGFERNGACAGYVAAAARAGRFDEAWRYLLSHYERSSTWGTEDACRVGVDDPDACPVDQRVSFNGYPDALRYYLAQWGYIPQA
jgi:hypothetical protein